jgi:hypothetical protein
MAPDGPKGARDGAPLLNFGECALPREEIYETAPELDMTPWDQFAREHWDQYGLDPQRVADPNFSSLDGFFNVEARLNIPCCADYDNDGCPDLESSVFRGRTYTSMLEDNFHSYNQARLLGGMMTMEIDGNIFNGALFMGRGDEDALNHHKLITFRDMVLGNLNLSPNFEAQYIANDAKGDLRMHGEVDLFGGIGHSESLRSREHLPYGFDNGGDVVCDSDGKRVTDPDRWFREVDRIRDNGFPTWWYFTDIMKFVEEISQVPPEDMCVDPDVVFRMPPNAENLISEVTVRGGVRVDGDVSVPATAMTPDIHVDIGTGAYLTLDATVKNPNSEWEYETDVCRAPLELSSLEAEINGGFDLVSVTLGDNQVDLPLQGDIASTISLSGILGEHSSPIDMLNHIFAHGSILVTGDIHVPSGPYQFGPMTVEVPEIGIRRGHTLSRLDSNLTVMKNGLGSVALSGNLSATVDTHGIQFGNMEIPGRQFLDLTVAGGSQGIDMALAGALTLPEMAFPMSVEAALTGGTINIHQLGVHLDPQTVEDFYTGTYDANIELANVRGRYDGQDAALGGSLDVEGQFSVDTSRPDHGPMISTALSFAVDLNGHLGLDTADAMLSGSLAVSDMESRNTSGELSFQRELNFQDVSATLGLGMEGLMATGAIISGTESIELAGQRVDPGIFLITDLSDAKTLGHWAEARMNLRLDGVRVDIPAGLDIPQGTYTLGGDLVASVGLVNVTEDPSHPDYRVAVGGLHAEVRNLELTAENVEGLPQGVATMLESGALNGGTLTLHDNENGVMRTEVRADSPALEALSFVLSRRVGAIFESDIRVDPEGIHTRVLDGTNADTISYYEPAAMNEVGMENMVLRVFQRNLGLLTITGNASVVGLLPDEDGNRNPALAFEFDHNNGHRRLRHLPEDVAITLSRGGGHISGTVNTTLDTEGNFSLDHFDVNARAFPFQSVTVNGVEASLPRSTSGRVPERGVARLHVDSDGFDTKIYTPSAVSIDGTEIMTVQGDRRLLRVRGSFRDDMSLRSVRTDVRFPESFTVNVTQPQGDGSTVTYNGVLTASDPNHPESETPPTISTRTRVSRRGSGRIEETSEDLQLTGILTRTIQDGAGNVTDTGALRIDQRTQWTFSGDFNTNGAINAHLAIPAQTLTGTVTDDLNISGETIAVGSQASFRMTALTADVAVNASTPSARLDWTAPNFSFNADVTTSSLGRIQARATVDNGGQSWRLLANANGVRVRALPGDNDLQPVRVELSATVGENTSITFESTSRAGGIEANYDATTGEAILDVSNIRLSSRVNGRAVVQALDLPLNNITTEANIPRVEVRYNSEANTVRVVVQAPSQPAIERPWETDITAWENMTAAGWEGYARQMGGLTHMVTLSESAADVPGSSAFLPQGRGEVYIDFKEPLDLTVNLNDLESSQQLTRLMDTLNNNLAMRRQFPNPPQRETGESVIFDEDQSRAYAAVHNDYPTPRVRGDAPIHGALFFVNPNDTATVTRLAGALGVNADEAISIIESGRMEIVDMYNHDNLRNVRRYVAARNFKTTILSALNEGEWNRNLTNHDGRALFLVQDMREHVRTLVRPMEVQGSLQNPHRGMSATQFSEAEYHANHPDTDGADMVLMGVLPMHHQRLYRILSDFDNAEQWDGWTSMSSSRVDGLDRRQAWGMTLDRYSYTVDTGTQNFGSEEDGYVSSVYSNLTSDSRSGFLARSRHDVLVPLRGRQGTLLIRNQFTDFGADGEQLDDVSVAGRDRRDPTVDPQEIPDILVGVIGGITSIMDSIQNINAPGQVAYAEFGTMMTRLHYGQILGVRNALEYRYVTGLPSFYMPVETGIREIRQAREFLAYVDIPVVGSTTDQTEKAITIDVTAAGNDLRARMIAGLGLEEAQADQFITNGRITLTELQQIPFLRDNFSFETIAGLVNAMLMPVETENPQHPMYAYNLQSRRFFDVMGDIHRRLPNWRRSEVDFRVYNNADYVRYAGTNSDRPDTLNTMTYFVLPGANNGGVTTQRYLETLNAAGDYEHVSTDFNAAESFSCPGQTDRTCTDTHLLVPALPDLFYRISGPDNLLGFGGGVTMSPWAREVQDRWEQPQGMMDNNGIWLGVPMSDGSTLVVRYGHINTRHRRERAVAGTARDRFAYFIEGIKQRAINPAWSHGGDDPNTRYRASEVFETD